MTKSQLTDLIAAKAPHVPRRDVESIVNAVFECMLDSLVDGDRIEIRGFGSFAVKVRHARDGRNPKTGEKVKVPERRTLAFTVGKELRDRLNRDFAPAPVAEEAEPEEAGPAPRAPASREQDVEALAAAPGGPRYTAS